MKMLIIEDSQEKLQRLIPALRATGLTADEIVITPDYSNGKSYLSTQQFDVLLVDLQIPARFSEDPKKTGGAELITWLFRHVERRPTPDHIYAITSYPVEDEHTQLVLQKNGIPVIVTSTSQSNWIELLAGIVKRVALLTKSKQQRTTAVVLTTVDVEHDQLGRVLGTRVDSNHERGVHWNHYQRRLDGHDSDVVRIATAQAGQMGMAAAVLLTQKAIEKWRPKIVIYTGICAGVRSVVQIGDLIIPDPCWDYGSGKATSGGGLQPDIRQIALHERVRSLLQRVNEDAPLSQWYNDWDGDKPRSVPRVQMGHAPSGSAVIADAQTTASIQSQSRKLLGLDMENYGFYYAATNSGFADCPDFFSVKAVVDFADSEKNDSYQKYGAHLSAKLAIWFIEQYAKVMAL